MDRYTNLLVSVHVPTLQAIQINELMAISTGITSKIEFKFSFQLKFMKTMM